jgi:hypothetical protein
MFALGKTTVFCIIYRLLNILSCMVNNIIDGLVGLKLLNTVIDNTSDDDIYSYFTACKEEAANFAKKCQWKNIDENTKATIKNVVVIAVSVIAVIAIAYVSIAYLGCFAVTSKRIAVISKKIFDVIIGVNGKVKQIDGFEPDVIIEEVDVARLFALFSISSGLQFMCSMPSIDSLRHQIKNHDKKSIYDNCKIAVTIIFVVGLFLLSLDDFTSKVWQIRKFLRLRATGINSTGDNINNLPVALILKAKHDFNGAFTLNNSVDTYDNIASKFFLRTKTIDNLTEAKGVINAVSKAFGKIDCLVLAAHGSPSAMMFSEEEGGLITRDTCIPDGCFDGLASKACVVLDSCATGGDNSGNECGNMVDFFADNIPGKTVVGPVISVLSTALNINVTSKNSIKIVFKAMECFEAQILMMVAGLDRFIPFFLKDISYIRY